MTEIVTASSMSMATPVVDYRALHELSATLAHDGARGMVATLIADDNFSFLFSTRLVEYRLPD